MALKLIKGIDKAHEILDRGDLLDMSSLPESVTARTREIFGEDVTPEQSVVLMLKDVRHEGDAAVRRYAKLLAGADLNDLMVEPKEMRQALDGISKDLRESLELAAQRVTDFHQAVMPKSWVDLEKGLGEMVRPLERVGLYAPGGTAAYPSSVLMTAIPARVAGV